MARKAAEAPSAKVAQLQNQMDALGGPALAKLKATVGELQKGISEAEEEAAKKRAQVITVTLWVRARVRVRVSRGVLLCVCVCLLCLLGGGGLGGDEKHLNQVSEHPT